MNSVLMKSKVRILRFEVVFAEADFPFCRLAIRSGSCDPVRERVGGRECKLQKSGPSGGKSRGPIS
jgi:hypothetical protein